MKKLYLLIVLLPGALCAADDSDGDTWSMVKKHRQLREIGRANPWFDADGQLIDKGSISPRYAGRSLSPASWLDEPVQTAPKLTQACLIADGQSSVEKKEERIKGNASVDEELIHDSVEDHRHLTTQEAARLSVIARFSEQDNAHLDAFKKANKMLMKTQASQTVPTLMHRDQVFKILSSREISNGTSSIRTKKAGDSAELLTLGAVT